MFFTNGAIETHREFTDQQGKSWLVVNGFPLVEGVLNGRLVTASEFGKYVEGWNGMPIVISHPKQNGGSARVPNCDVPVVGTFFNARVDNSNRLIGEFYLDKMAMMNDPQGRMIVNTVLAGGQVEVSTGYYSASYPEPGTWNGTQYTLVDRDLKPDHIALLVDQDGACSIKDGCGLNRNMKQNACDCAACNKRNSCERSQFQANVEQTPDKTMPAEVDPIQENLLKLFEFAQNEKLI